MRAVCHYCGCREIPLIKEFIAEHEKVTDASGDLARRLEAESVDRRPPGAREYAILRGITEELVAHWAGEENGLFAVMREDPEYGDYIDALVREHRELAELLDSVDLGRATDRARLLGALEDLHAHIAKEEDGLFPASLTALSGEDWNASMRAWREAHPLSR
jgi:iron-sulfur cluster repair protein YtfE (RIC family)